MRRSHVFLVIVLGGLIGLAFGMFKMPSAIKGTNFNPHPGHKLLPHEREDVSVSVTLPDTEPGSAKPFHSPIPGKLIVKAQAHIVNKLMDEPFVWNLVIKDHNSNVIASHVYQNQPFVVMTGLSHHPEFAEEMDIQPGTYHVEVYLLSNTPGQPSAGGVGFTEIVQ